MVQIAVHNSYSRITGLTVQQFAAARKLLSYEIEQPYATTFQVRTKYLLDAKGNFPSGLLPRLSKHLLAKGVRFQMKDTRIAPARLDCWSPWFGPELYAEQRTAALAAMKAKRGIISMPTGTGKSMIIALLAHWLGHKTLVVVPTLELKRQLSSLLAELKNVTVQNIDSIKPGKYDVLIIDEAHHVAASTYQKHNRTTWKDIYYRFFLTATPFRTRKDEDLLFEGIAGEVIFKLSYRKAVELGYIVPVEAYYVDVPKTAIEGDTWASVYRQMVVENDVRNELIASLIAAIDAPCLTLVKEIAHGKALAARSGVEFANGQDKASTELIREFSDGSRDSLIGTTGILGEGVDTKPCQYVVIAGLGKAKGAFMQQVGRAVRKWPGKESAKIILFRDSSHKWGLRHFKSQVKILKEEYGITPIKIDL